jgi:hypothetical protein
MVAMRGGESCFYISRKPPSFVSRVLARRLEKMPPLVDTRKNLFN